MPALLVIDALIFLGWSSLSIAMFLRSIYITTSARPAPFGLYPRDCLTIAVVLLLFALTLAGRTWVKANEPELLARRRRAPLAEAGYDEDFIGPAFARGRGFEPARGRLAQRARRGAIKVSAERKSSQ
jgi:hypothetical protein